MEWSDLLNQFSQQQESAANSLEKIAKSFENISLELGALKNRLQEHIDSYDTNQNKCQES